MTTILDLIKKLEDFKNEYGNLKLVTATTEIFDIDLLLVPKIVVEYKGMRVFGNESTKYAYCDEDTDNCEYVAFMEI